MNIPLVLAGKTAKSILISCGARLAPFDINEEVAEQNDFCGRYGDMWKKHMRDNREADYRHYLFTDKPQYISTDDMEIIEKRIIESSKQEARQEANKEVMNMMGSFLAAESRKICNKMYRAWYESQNSSGNNGTFKDYFSKLTFQKQIKNIL